MAFLKKKKKIKKDYFLPIVVIVGLFLLTLLLDAVVMSDNASTPVVAMPQKAPITQPVKYNGRTHVVAIDQAVKNSITVLSVALDKPSFVVVQKINPKGVLGEPIAFSKLLQPGLYSNRTVELLTPVISGDELQVSVYSDNGDGTFSWSAKKSKTSDQIETGYTQFYAL